MKIRLFIFTMLLALAPFAQAQQKGYWVLQDTKLKRDVIGFGNVSDPNKVWPKLKENYASTGSISVTWEDPPEKIPFGEESDYISSECHMNFPPGTSQAEEKVYTYRSSWMVYEADNAANKYEGGFKLNGNKYGGILTIENFPQLDPKKDYVMTVQLGALAMAVGTPSAGQIYYYRYYDPDKVVEVTTEGTMTTGEWVAIGVGALLVGGGAVAIGKGKGKGKTGKGKGKGNKDKNKDKEKEKEKDKEEEEEKKEPTYQMVLFKDFGDTLFVGDEPKQIGARIEEVTPEGLHNDRPDLTAKILIKAEEHCMVEKTGVQGRYCTAKVKAGKNADGTTPGTAKVEIMFRGDAGLLIDHVVFKVKDAPKIIVDEAITFEAESGATQHMDFGINNFNGTVLGVEVTIDSGGEKYFTSKVENPDPQLPLKFRINLTERGKPKEVTATAQGVGNAAESVTKVQKHVAGDAGRFLCYIKVRLEGREDPIKESFAIYRFHLGVNLDINALKGYLVTYDSTYKQETLVTDPKSRKKWGESRAAFKLIAPEKGTNKIKVLLPDSDPVFIFEDVWEGSVRFADKNGVLVESLCRLMNFKFDFQEVTSDGTVVGVIHSTGGGLLPPNRGKAKVTVRVTYNGVTYEDSDTVTICSQPYRIIDDEREYSRVLHEDEEKMRQLTDIRRKILTDDRFGELAPFYYKLYVMIEGYSNAYGFYEPDYQKMMRVFKKYCSGEMGTYFVNDSVWRPDWTEADENFNAFLATFASMERNLWLLPARIALAYFTAGASEVVLAPYSGLVRMQQYAVKTNFSQFEGFVLASAEVLIWEGVFYLAGKAVKKVGGKIVDYAVEKGYDKQLKSAYDEIKKTVEEYMRSRSASEGLKNTKNFSTKQLADKVKDAGEQTIKSNSVAKAKAKDIIQKTIESGDDAVRFGSPKFNEECAKWAKKDAEKIFENFKKVMNDPTATPEQMRRATLALQGNKAAQNLLRECESDLLRANFNHNIQKIYSEVDPMTIKKLAKRLGVPESDIHVWNGATSNAGGDLYMGRKIGADRDVTFQVKKDGKWVDIEECIQEQAYAEAFNEYHYGFMPEDMQEAIKTLRKLDQAVVNGEKGLESFGRDLKNIIDPNFQTSKLLDPERVSKTVKYKCEFWMNQGRSCRDQAEQLFKSGLIDEAKHVMGYGEELVKEGVRMNVKEFKRILAPRIQALKVKGLPTHKYDILAAKINILDAVGTPPPKGVTQISLQEARNALAKEFGNTLEEVVNECTNVIKEINESL